MVELKFISKGLSKAKIIGGMTRVEDDVLVANIDAIDDSSLTFDAVK